MSGELRELSDFFDNAAVALHWVGPDGTILRANRAELELLGYAHDEYVGRNIVEFHVDRPVIEALLRRLAAGETVRNYEARLRCKDGSVRDVLVSSNVQWVDGKFAHTRCFTQDITERKRVELLRTETSDYLEGLMEGFVAYDGGWTMTYINAAGERILGRRREDVLGKTWHQAFPHAVGNEVDQMYQRVMRTRTAEQMEYFYPHYGRWMEISASPVRTGGVGVYFRDISDRKRAEEELRESGRRKDEFLATLAHELRNPLAPIRSGLQVLQVSKAGSDASRQAMAMMERQVVHLVRLLDDLMEVSRVTQGRLVLRKRIVNLAEAVQTAVEAARPLLAAGLHQLAVDLPPQPIRVLADPVRLAQVLANLLNNAAKFTPDGGRISLSARRLKGHAVLRVQDNGVGIAAEMLPRVFEKFAQAPGALTRSHGGLGIGLSLARTLVELHGGTIEARSEGEGKGAEFVVSLPALAAPPPEGSGP